jgi:hypothetical protein
VNEWPALFTPPEQQLERHLFVLRHVAVRG